MSYLAYSIYLNMRTSLLASLIALFSISITSQAQNWTVGVPVSMLLSDLTLNSDNCWNQGMQADDVIFFPNSLVDGIDHIYVINSTSQGVGFGAPNNVVNVGDTVHITQPQQQFQIYFTGGPGGSLSLSVYAAGTPTMPGQQHPCAASNLWFGNLLICNTGINNNIQTNCTTQSATAVSDVSSSEPLAQLPSPQTGNVLSISNVSPSALLVVYDITGSVVSKTTGTQLGTGISLNHLQEGIYFYSLVFNGQEYTKKFVLSK